MLENIINTINHLSREEWKVILSILSLLVRMAFNQVVFYQEKQYHGKRVIKEQIKIDYKTIYNTIDFIISIAKLFL